MYLKYFSIIPNYKGKKVSIENQFLKGFRYVAKMFNYIAK